MVINVFRNRCSADYGTDGGGGGEAEALPEQLTRS